MSAFNAADYGIEWPTDPTGIIQEALREYVSDGDGADEAVLVAYTRQVIVATLRDLAGVGWMDFETSRKIRERAQRIENLA